MFFPSKWFFSFSIFVVAPRKDDDSALSTGGAVGIALALLFLIALIVLALLFVRRRHKKRTPRNLPPSRADTVSTIAFNGDSMSRRHMVVNGGVQPPPYGKYTWVYARCFFHSAFTHSVSPYFRFLFHWYLFPLSMYHSLYLSRSILFYHLLFLHIFPFFCSILIHTKNNNSKANAILL